MITLSNVAIHKYKSIEQGQSFNVEPKITVLVGMNESGKTSILEAMAKSNYFEDDAAFKYNLTHDYPRKQKKAIDKSGVVPEAVTLTYEISTQLKDIIESDLSIILPQTSFTRTVKYDGSASVRIIPVAVDAFLKSKLKSLKVEDGILKDLSSIKNKEAFDAYISGFPEDNPELLAQIEKLGSYFLSKCTWDNPVEYYMWRKHLSPNLPKFMYYDDYYMLPSIIELESIEDKSPLTSSEKTAKALLELADIDISKITDPTEFEDVIAELEATQAIISSELFKYWSTNNNLKIQFSIESVEEEVTTAKPVAGKPNTFVKEQIVKHNLNVRVQNQRSGVSLPLANRSKGFNWFFSFLVWFKKIQEDAGSTFILLLDEPGLNLHAKAQNDLLQFLTDLSDNYQIIYTTHSPFMIDSGALGQVRTVVERDDGTQISESVQEKDPNTLFPLQAALGYDLAQNLFVSPKNLIVEGIADLVYLNLLSEILRSAGKAGLKDSITIIPVGGADKVATFVSLLRGNELDMVCLLDTFTDQSAKQRLENLVAQHIIKDKKIIFYNSITGTSHADVEDLFEVADYLQLYNGAFSKAHTVGDIDGSKPILAQLKKLNGGKDYNHYSPANFFAKNVADIHLSEGTLKNFEKLFTQINKLL